MRQKMVLAGLCYLLQIGFAAAATERQALLISDVHFDPTADPSLVPQLLAAPVRQWEAIFQASKNTPAPAYKQDTNWRLFQPALAAMKATLPHPSFVLFTGDLLAHHLRDRVSEADKAASDEQYRTLVKKTVEFVALELRAAFGKTPILYSLGNNDNTGEDYAIEPGGVFLADSAKAVHEMAEGSADSAFEENWHSLGNFTAHVKGLAGIRILMLNTNFWSPKYTGDSQAGARELAWLRKQLTETQRKRERAWLVFHIPPGVDGYATERRCENATCSEVVTMWTAQAQANFEQLLASFPDVVAASFAGHTHMDEFRLLPGKQFVVMSPAITAWNGENPAYRVLDVGPHGELLDMRTYYTDLKKSADPKSSGWRLEYDFDQKWQAKRIDGSAFQNVFDTAMGSKAGLDRWLRLYSVERHSLRDTPASSAQALLCATALLDPEAFLNCYQQHAP